MNTSDSSKLAKKKFLHESVSFSRLLVPVDFSLSTFETLRYARVLAEKFGGVVDILHVIPYRFGRHQETFMRLDLIRTVADGARNELQRLVGILKKRDDTAIYSIRIREGGPCDVILQEASATNATLIVLGLRPRSWLSGLIRNHTVERILQGAPCPVMVLRVGRTAAAENHNQPAGFQVPPSNGG